MECTLIKGNEIQFGTYGFEHIDLPPERPDYWDTKVKVAKINRREHRCYELEELRSYECWSLLTPKLRDSITHKLDILSVVSL